jgi:hypothetical protein
LRGFILGTPRDEAIKVYRGFLVRPECLGILDGLDEQKIGNEAVYSNTVMLFLIFLLHNTCFIFAGSLKKRCAIFFGALNNLIVSIQLKMLLHVLI